MNLFEEQYLVACRAILTDGHEVMDRTGVGTKMLTNVMLEHSDIDKVFPLPITKKLATKSVIGELLWFLEGSTSDRRLAEITYGDGDHKTIWTANWEAKGVGSPKFEDSRQLGPVYGAQWRSFGPLTQTVDARICGVDQLRDVLERIKTKPADRRHVITAWAPHEIDSMSLPPCHMIYQFNVIGDQIDLLMMQRSGDMFLGVPFNMASYALLLKIVAKETGYKAGKVSIVIGNAHIYSNHEDQMWEQISRRKSLEYQDYLRKCYWNMESTDKVALPQILINNDSQLFNSDGSVGYKVSDFTVTNYKPLPAIRGDMAV